MGYIRGGTTGECECFQEHTVNIESLGRMTSDAPSRAVAVVSLHRSDPSPPGSDVWIRNLGL